MTYACTVKFQYKKNINNLNRYNIKWGLNQNLSPKRGLKSSLKMI